MKYDVAAERLNKNECRVLFLCVQPHVGEQDYDIYLRDL